MGGFCAFSLTGFDSNGEGFWCACAHHEEGYAYVNGSAYFFLFGGAKSSFLKKGAAAIEGAESNWQALLKENDAEDLRCFNTARITPVAPSDAGARSPQSDEPCDMMSCLAFMDCTDCK